MATWMEIHSALAQRHHLSSAQIRWAMNQILNGVAPDEEIKNFLIGLRDKGESVDEVNALVDEMYTHAHLIEIPDRAVDPVGTGGDGFNTINISTAAAIVTTAAGARVMKHGNRAATSKSGAADLLEAFDIDITLNASAVAECVRKIGIGFAFAPVFHPAMRHAAPVRKALGLPTIFNILGPLANPARVKVVSIGVTSAERLQMVTNVLALRGCEGFVFRGDEGIDEISISGTTTINVIQKNSISTSVFDPQEIGIPLFPLTELAGGDAHLNAQLIREVFNGAEGAKREAILLNAAAAIAAFKGDFDLPLQTQIANGFVLANKAIDSGAAQSVLKKWVELSNEIVSAR